MSDDDRKELLDRLANHVLKVWAITQLILREPKPDWLALDSVLADQEEELKKARADVRARG